jgi:hypothetical protein
MRQGMGLVVVMLALVASPTARAAKPVYHGLRSPSGNIRCLVTEARLWCTLRHADFRGRLQQQCIDRASLDWHGFDLAIGARGGPVCSGGILYDARRRRLYPELPYGSTWRRSAFTCTSRRTGLTCTTRSGHGLFVSRESWRGW